MEGCSCVALLPIWISRLLAGLLCSFTVRKLSELGASIDHRP